MGTLFVDKLDPQSGTALELGSSGDTITIPSGATITNSGTATGFGEANTPAFSAFLDSTQSLSDQTYTIVGFDNEIYDTDSAYDNSNFKFTVPSGKAGKYFFTAMLRFVNFTGEVRLVIYINGSQKGYQSSYAGNKYQSLSAQFSADLSVGDYVQIQAWQDSGGSLNLAGDSSVPQQVHFQGFKISSWF